MSTYTVTLTTEQAVAAELALEARIEKLTDLRASLVDYKNAQETITDIVAAQGSIASIDTSIATTTAALQLIKLAPLNSPGLSAMLAADNVTRAQAQGVGSALRQNAGE